MDGEEFHLVGTNFSFFSLWQKYTPQDRNKFPTCSRHARDARVFLSGANCSRVADPGRKQITTLQAGIIDTGYSDDHAKGDF